MSQPLRVLIVEDNENDVALLQHALRRGGYDITCEVVDTPAAMRTLLENQNWDVITSDHAMPQFSAPAALALAKEIRPDVPLIIVSGEISLTLAVTLMRDGAKDYIQKRELVLLIPAIERELREVELRCERQRVDQALHESQEHLREVLENSLDASYKRNLQINAYSYMSPVFARITGYTPDEMSTLPIEIVLSFMHPDDVAEVERVIAESMSGDIGIAHQITYRFKHKNGQYRWLQDRFTVIRETGGQALARIGSVSDVTERKLAEDALREDRQRLASIIRGTHVGTWEWNIQTGETIFNERWAEIIGYTLAEIGPVSIETWMKYAHPDDLKSSDELLEKHFRGELDYYEFESRMRHKDGTWVWVLDRGKVTSWTEDGKPLWMMGTHQDVTERKLAEEALSERNENLRIHQIELEVQNEELRRTQLQLDAERARYFDLWEMAPVGYVIVSETGLILAANLTAINLLGVPRTLLVNRFFTQFLLKEDQDRYYLHHRRLLKTGEPQSFELRIVNDDDPPGVTWANLEAAIVPDDAGECADPPGPDERGKSPRRAIRIVLSDISERKQAEAALRESEEKYRTVADFTYDWEAWRGPDGTTRYISPSCERISGHTVAEFMADPHLLVKITHPDDRSRISEHYFSPDAEAQGQDSEFDFRILTAKGETRWISHCCTAVYGEDGRWLGRRESNRDITARKESEDKIGLLNTDLDRLAHVDEMTGIHNRRSILFMAEHEFNVAMRYRPPLSILFFDIDYFKQINDTFGHAIGDQALKQIVQAAGAEIRSADVIGRFGGDEFIVLLPQTSVQEALPLAERIRAQIAALCMDTDKGPVTLTISMGITQTIHRVGEPGDIPPAPADTVENLLRRADQALYAAKQAGRNRTMIYDPEKTGAS